MTNDKENAIQVRLVRILLKKMGQELLLDADDNDWIIKIYPEGTFPIIGSGWRVERSRDLEDVLTGILVDFIMNIENEEV